MDVHVNQHKERVIDGYRLASSSRLVVAGLARDVEYNIENYAQQIDKLGRRFNDYRVVIVENDSTDSTLGKLEEWQETTGKVVILNGGVGEKFWKGEKTAERAFRMAQYRNVYLDYIAENYSRWSYVLVLDFDLQYWSNDGVFHSLAHPLWDAMFGNGKQTCAMTGEDVYYDTWATIYTDGTSPTYQPIYDKYSPPFLVHSGFGGMALYKLPIMTKFRYNGLLINDGSWPDHVGLHATMRLQGYDRLYVNPGMITRRF
jgi:hypothetical protein